jgi:phosphate transport system substrate-binding protein
MQIGKVKLGPGSIILLFLVMLGLLFVGLRQLGFDPISSLKKSPGTADEPASTGGSTTAPANTVRLKGSSAINGQLGKDLAQAFMAANPGTIVLVESQGTGPGMESLLGEQTEIAAASRAANEKELAKFKEKGFDLESPDSEHVIGFDAIAVVVNPANPVERLTKQQLADIFTGKTKDWSAVGGKAGPIKVILRPKELGAYEVFQELVLGKGVAFTSDGEEIKENPKVAARVTQDTGAIAFVALGGIGGAKALEIAAGAETRPVKPSETTIRDQSYLLTRKLYLYTRGRQSGLTGKFIEFAVKKGQEMVANAGFVNLSLKSTPGSVPGGGQGERLSTDVRFRSGGTDVNSLAVYDLTQALERYCNQSGKVRLIGYSDNQGGDAANRELSLKRARAVAELMKLKCPTLEVEPIGQGSASPIGDNSTEVGRLMNRRVEIWFMPR